MVGNKSSCLIFKILSILVLLFAEVKAGLPEVYNHGTFVNTKVVLSESSPSCLNLFFLLLEFPGKTNYLWVYV